jgi:tRNA pseudouridine55 synthase
MLARMIAQAKQAEKDEVVKLDLHQAIVVNLPLTSSVYFKNGNPVRNSGTPFDGLVRVTEGDEGKFIGMGEIDDEGRVAPRRLVVEYPA